MALPQDGVNMNELPKTSTIPTGKELLFIDPTTNEGGVITLEDLTKQILQNLTSQTFALDQGTKTLPAALNELNSNLNGITYVNAGVISGTMNAKEAARGIIDNTLTQNKNKIFLVTFFCAGEKKMIAQTYTDGRYASYIMFGYGMATMIFDQKQNSKWID